ncbi:hypothetical protein JCM8547_005933 [Rhodosporidiobolus lusitaniae]
MKLLTLVSTLSALVALVHASPSPSSLSKSRLSKRDSRTSAPSGAVTVDVAGSGSYTTISAALEAGETSIFILPGTYEEQVSITQDGTVLYGYTSAVSSYSSNEVTITYGLSQLDVSGNDATGTLRIHANDVSIFKPPPFPSPSPWSAHRHVLLASDNLNVVNSYGKGSQALALSAYGERQGFYGCSFSGYQDTILTNEGTQYFVQNYVEGATDFIFGQTANTYFTNSILAIVGAGYIAAPGRESDDETGMYVFNSCTIKQADSVSTDLTGQAYLGRPWRNYARAVYKYCSISSVVNSAGWHIWNTGDERTDNILFGEYQNSARLLPLRFPSEPGS